MALGEIERLLGTLPPSAAPVIDALKARDGMPPEVPQPSLTPVTADAPIAPVSTRPPERPKLSELLARTREASGSG